MSRIDEKRFAHNVVDGGPRQEFEAGIVNKGRDVARKSIVEGAPLQEVIARQVAMFLKHHWVE